MTVRSHTGLCGHYCAVMLHFVLDSLFGLRRHTVPFTTVCEAAFAKVLALALQLDRIAATPASNLTALLLWCVCIMLTRCLYGLCTYRPLVLSAVKIRLNRESVRPQAEWFIATMILRHILRSNRAGTNTGTWKSADTWHVTLYSCLTSL